MDIFRFVTLALSVILVSTVSAAGKSQIHLQKDFYCMGCQLTLKVLSGYLGYKTAEPVEKRVKQSLKTICSEDNFKTSEYKPAIMVDACKDILKNHGITVEQVLVDYYKSKDRSMETYIPVMTEVCHKRIPACTKKENDEIKKQGGLVYNPDTDSFEVVPGDNVKFVRPTQQMHNEL